MNDYCQNGIYQGTKKHGIKYSQEDDFNNCQRTHKNSSKSKHQRMVYLNNIKIRDELEYKLVLAQQAEKRERAKLYLFQPIFRCCQSTHTNIHSTADRSIESFPLNSPNSLSIDSDFR
ncbi:unnamed protein product [Caenorhabditis brenneri]